MTAALIALPMLAHAQGATTNNIMGASASSSASAAQGIGNGGTSSGNNVTNPRQAPAVGAPSLAASSEACMGSASAGVSVAGFGIAGGGTFTNEECQRRLNSQQLRLLGHNDAALAILCVNAGVADALAAVGKACPAPRPMRAEVPQQPAAGAASSFCRTWPADPYCRAGQ